ncbi:MAG: UDP-glucose 4-epimerase GalE [Miltoncostaeaceae bacterium]
MRAGVPTPTAGDPLTWLLTGGAGYIGAHIARALRAAGTPVVVLDDLSTGYREYVPDDVPLVEGSVADPAAVDAALDRGATGVLHLAGLKYAGVSVQRPLEFFHANVTGMQVLMEAVARRGIDRVLFSSSASWYGTPQRELVDEDTPPAPESPYGQSKVISEWLLRDVARTRPALRHTSLRYFNVCGSGPPEIADHSPHNLFPRVFRMLSAGEAPTINGTDYPTPDGTCVRDYIHVVDLADAHVAAARALDAGSALAPAYNVGRGVGSSVRQVLDAIARETGIALAPVEGPRRAGDPARIVGAVDRIRAELGWTARHDLDAMVRSAWAAWEWNLARHGGAPPGGGRWHSGAAGAPGRA